MGNNAVLTVCEFLTLKEILLRLQRANKFACRHVRSLLDVIFRAHFIDGEQTLATFDYKMLRELLRTKSNLLEFKPLYYNGGVSKWDVESSFETMWQYSGSIYSTFYDRNGADLVGNRICAAYFSGASGENLMWAKFNYELDMVQNRVFELPDRTMELLKSLHGDAVTKDFLFETTPQDQSKAFMDTMMWARRCRELHIKPIISPMERTYPYEPRSEAVAVVREVAIARPITFTGAVKTMMIFAGRRPGNEYSPDIFKKWEDIDTVEKAAGLERSTPIRTSDGVQYIEYEPAPGDYYPLMWVYFPDCTHNRTRIKLSRPHTFKQTTVMMYTIEDQRERSNLMEMQPNFDIMFVVFLGALRD